MQVWSRDGCVTCYRELVEWLVILARVVAEVNNSAVVLMMADLASLPRREEDGESAGGGQGLLEGCE